MKNFNSPLRWFKYILLTLLALACVAAVELAVCFYQSPELYQRITAPIREGLRQAAEVNQRVWTHLSGAVNDALDTAAVRLEDTWEQFSAHFGPEEPDGDIQLVDNTTVAPPPRPKASFTITDLIERDGQEYLTGGAQELVYYNQTAEPWADLLYGTDNIGGYGCGPTAMAMVVDTVTESPTDPAQMAQYCVDIGCWAKKHGSYRSIVQKVAEDFGLECESLAMDDKEQIYRCLSSGQLIVALMGPGHFTNGGHFILLRGVTMDNSILVADPASLERSLTTWDLDLILEELSASRDSGGPLWAVYPGFFSQ